MNFNLNLQNAQKLGNYMQPGQYSVKVKNFDSKNSKNGHPQFVITFTHRAVSYPHLTLPTNREV